MRTIDFGGERALLVTENWGPYQKGDVIYHGCVVRMVPALDPEDDDDQVEDDPDLPDEWRDHSERPDDTLNERLDAEGFPRF
jgi:hypothetical protein